MYMCQPPNFWIRSLTIAIQASLLLVPTVGTEGQKTVEHTRNVADVWFSGAGAAPDFLEMFNRPDL